MVSKHWHYLTSTAISFTKTFKKILQLCQLTNYEKSVKSWHLCYWSVLPVPSHLNGERIFEFILYDLCITLQCSIVVWVQHYLLFWYRWHWLRGCCSSLGFWSICLLHESLTATLSRLWGGGIHWSNALWQHINWADWSWRRCCWWWL